MSLRASSLAFLLPSHLGRNSRWKVGELNVSDLWPIRMFQWVRELVHRLIKVQWLQVVTSIIDTGMFVRKLENWWRIVSNNTECERQSFDTLHTAFDSPVDRFLRDSVPAVGLGDQVWYAALEHTSAEISRGCP